MVRRPAFPARVRALPVEVGAGGWRPAAILAVALWLLLWPAAEARVTVSSTVSVDADVITSFDPTARAVAADHAVTLTVADAPGSDFLAALDEGWKTVTIPKGKRSATQVVNTVADGTDEPDGEVTVPVAADGNDPAGYTLAAGASATVQDDDTTVNPVNLSIGSGGAIAEGAAALTLTATLAAANGTGGALSIPVQVRASGTTAQAADYTLGGTISIADGAQTGTTTLAVADDSDDEPVETVVVELGSALPAGVTAGGTDHVTVTISDNDPTSVSLSAAQAAIAESGAGNTSEVTLTLGRDLVAGESVTVPLAVTGATVATHYTLGLKGGGGRNQGVVLQSAHPHSAQDPAIVLAGAGARIAVLELAAVDNDDMTTRTVSLAFGSGARAPGSTGLGGGIDLSGSPASVAIADDDSGDPEVSIAGKSPDWQAEDRPMVFTISLDRVLATDLDVRVRVSGTHFVAPGQEGTRVVTIPAGALSVDFNVEIVDDNMDEADDRVLAEVLAGPGYSVNLNPGSASIWVSDNDGGPTVSVLQPSPEVIGEASFGTQYFTVKANPPPAARITVSLQVDASGGAALGATGMGSVTVDIPTSGSATHGVTVTDDKIDEPNGRFTAVVQPGTGYLVTRHPLHNNVSVWVVDDDRTSVTLAGAAGNLTESQTKALTLTLGRGLVQHSGVTETLTVPLTFAGTATLGSDYTLAGTPATGVTYRNLASDDAEVMFTGPATGTSATVATLTLTAVADAVVERVPETVDIGLGPLKPYGLGGTKGALGADELAEFSIEDRIVDGVTVSTASLALSERGEAATYTLVLNTDPGADVAITVASGDTGAATVDTDSDQQGSQDTLTFTPGDAGNWDEPQTVRVMAVNDGDAANETLSLTHTATVSDTDHRYHGIEIDGLSVTVADAGHGLVVSEATVSVAEGDDTASYEIALKSDPGGTVVVRPGTDDAATATVSGALTFSGADWFTPQAVTVTGKSPGQVNVTHAITAGTTDYPAATSLAPVAVTVTPLPRVSMKNGGIAVVEEGDTAEIVVRLSTSSDADQTIPLILDDSNTTPGADYPVPDPVSVTIPAGTTEAVFRLPILADGIPERREGLRVRIDMDALPAAIRPGTPEYADVSIAAQDGVTVYPTRLDLVERPATTLPANTLARMTYRLVLHTDPGADVTIAVTSSDPGAVTVDTDDDMPGDQDTLTFTHGNTGNWGDWQSVTARALVDGDLASETVTLSHAATVMGDPTHAYHGIDIAPVTATVADAGRRVALSDAMISVADGDGTTTYDIVLTSVPGGTVTVTPVSDDSTKATVSGPVSFDNTDWRTPKPVTLTGKARGSATVTHSITTGTDDYPTSLPVPELSVTVDPDTRPRVTLSIADRDGKLAEGGDETQYGEWTEYYATLTGGTLPELRAIPILVSGADPADYEVISEIVIKAGAAGGDQSFQVVSDDLDEPNETVTLAFGSLPAELRAGAVTSVEIEIIDRDPTAVTLARKAGETGAIDEKSGIAEFTVALGRNLVAGEVVTAPLVLSGPGITGGDYTVRRKAGASLNHGVTLLTAAPHSAAAPAVQFAGAGSDVSASTVGTATLELVATDDDLDEGQSETLTLALGTVVSNLDRVSGTGATGTTVTGTATVTITDDDILTGIRLVESGDDTVVGEDGPGTDTYTVALHSKPTHDVTVTLTADAGIEVGTTGAPAAAATKTLTFTPTNWLDPQTVTVHAMDNPVDDASRREVEISHAATSVDPSYSAPAASVLAVVVIDDDATTVTLSAPAGDIAEDGSNKVVTVALGRALVAGERLTVPLTFGGAATRGVDYAVRVQDGQVASGVTYTNLASGAASVTFTGAAGASPSASFTLESMADEIDEGASETVSVALGALDGDSGTGLEGGASGTGSVSFSITDDDTAGVAVTVSTGVVMVATGAEATYTLRLTSEPVGTVAITPTSEDPNTAGIQANENGSTGRLYFDAGNWQEPQTVTVEGVAAGGPMTIGHAVTYAAGGGYGTDLAINPVLVTVTEATKPVLNLSLAGGALREGEWRDVTLRLTGATGRVLVDTVDLLSVSGVNSGDYRLDLPARIAFRAPDYARTYQLWALPDDMDEQNETLTIGFGSGFPATLDRGSEATVTVIDGNPTAVTFALAGEDDLVEGDETSATVTLGRGLRAGETVTVPLVVAGTGVDASDYTLTLDTGASSSGVELARSAPYSSHQPAVVFTGSDDAAVTTATLDLTTLEDGAAETREAFTLWMGTLDSNLDQETGTGARGTAARGGAAFIQLRDRVAPVSGAPEVRISHKFLPVVENGPPGRYLLWLGSDPGQDVTVEITSGDPARVQVEPAELTFTTRGETIWSEAQTVTVTALADADGGQDSTVTLTHAVTGYPGVASPPPVTVTHRDAGHGVMASTRTLELSEGATAEYTLRLLSRPTHAVTVTPLVSDSGAVLRGGEAVTFQPNEWETEKTFAVAGLSPGRATVTHDVSSTDSSYGGAGGTRYGVAPLAVTVASAPTRIAGAAFTIAPDTASVVGGAAAAFTVSAGNALAGDVAVEVDIADGGDVVAAGQFLTRKVLVPAGGSSRLSLATKPFPADRPDGAVTATLAARYGGASASVQVVDNLPTPVSLDFGADLRLREQTPGDTAEVKVTLGRDLAPGEVVEVPLAFATTDGVALPGAAAPHVAVSARGTGVTLLGATTTTPTVRFTGGAGVERVATVELAATATVDANLTDDTFTIGLGDLAAATLATTVSGGAVATGGSNQARLTLVDNQEAFEVSLAGGDDLGLVEALPGDTATVTVALERDLAAGETVEVPLAFASTTGVVLPGGTTPHVQVLSATGAGVTLHGATTTTPTVRFTGGAGSEQVATVAMAATGQDDGDTADDSFTVTLGDLAAGGLATNLGEPVTPAAGANLAVLTLFDDDNPFTVALRAGGDARLLEEAPGDTGSVVVLLERDLVAGELVEVPLAFASTSGLTLPGGSTPHVQVLSATGAGVSLHDAATATPKVRITGGAGSERVAEILLAATGLDDGNRTDDTFTVSLGDLSDATLATELTGAVTASGASHSAVLTVIDNDVGVAISDASAAEGEAMVFTVSLPKRRRRAVLRCATPFMKAPAVRRMRGRQRRLTLAGRAAGRSPSPRGRRAARSPFRPWTTMSTSRSTASRCAWSRPPTVRCTGPTTKGSAPSPTPPTCRNTGS